MIIHPLDGFISNILGSIPSFLPPRFFLRNRGGSFICLYTNIIRRYFRLDLFSLLCCLFPLFLLILLASCCLCSYPVCFFLLVHTIEFGRNTTDEILLFIACCFPGRFLLTLSFCSF